jgi:hypothetical protein
MMNEAPFQLNIKTPGGTLINLRATTSFELDEQISAIIQRSTDIADLEQHLGLVGTLSNAGLKPQPVAAPAAPAHNYAPAAPAAPQMAGSSPSCDHGLVMRLVPAGISKAGKPYTAFYACPNPRETACAAKG